MTIVIIGGGLAGSAAAMTLARAGRDVTLIEREPRPHHKVCGEFLSREALLYLNTLGVHPETLGAVPIHHVRLANSAQQTLPFAAMSLTRRTLDEHLLQAAERAGVNVLRGCPVQALTPDPDHTWTLTLPSTTLHADTVFVATGKHDLRAHPRPAGPQPNLVAFKMYFRLTPAQTVALSNSVELILYPGGYAGLQPVEDGIANFTCLIHRRVLQHLGGWEELLSAMQSACPLLRERLHGAHHLLAKPLAISSIPYGYVRDAPASANNLWYLGDQAAVIPSFTGDGMSIALHSGCLAATMFLQGKIPAQFQRQLHSEVARQVRFATAISRALLWAPTRTIVASAVGAFPALLDVVACRTRIKESALPS